MDAKKLGSFIAEQRKEKNMTQAKLAEMLHVTDKAVSKWERGLGFPDINTIEPLADALGVSILEVMHSERISEEQVSHESASDILMDAFDMVKLQRKQERKHLALISVGVLVSIILFFLGDTMGLMGILGVVLPCLCAAMSICFVLYGIWRRRNQLPCARPFIFAILIAIIPIILICCLFIAGLMGSGPIPS